VDLWWNCGYTAECKLSDPHTHYGGSDTDGDKHTFVVLCGNDDDDDRGSL